MAGGTSPPVPPEKVPFTCPRCGAPLPTIADSGFVTCDFCGVRTDISSLLPPRLFPTPIDGQYQPPALPPEPAEDDSGAGGSSYAVRVVVAIIAVLILIAAVALFAASPPQSTSTGSSTPHCSVAINASAASGAAPFTATFTAEITAPAGDSTGQPMWQFGPFPSGPDLNFTYGSSVTHTWGTAGSYGVHVSVPDSTGQGCYTTMSVTVT